MNRKLQISTLLVLVFMSVGNVFCQNTKITMLDGKVLEGYGKQKNLAGYVKYKPTEDAAYEKIKLKEINKVSFYRKRDTLSFAMRAIKKGRKRRPLELLFDGNHIEILFMRLPGAQVGNVSIENGRIFVRRKNEEGLTMLRSNAILGKTFEQRAEAYFTDCPDLVSKLGSDGFKKKDYKKVVQYYDENCGGSSVGSE